MKSIEIHVASHKSNYSVKIGRDLFPYIDDMVDFSKFSALYIITDSNVVKYHHDEADTIFSSQALNIYTHTFIMNAGEKNKNLSTVEKIYHDLAEKRVDRKALIINLGGGVVTDIGGYVAATYLRGISFINIPTTLEAMVDASVGGKTGVNLGNLKNYVGSFAQPLLVAADILTLETLPDRVFLQGYAEVIKHALIADKEYFVDATSEKPLEMSDEKLIDIISRSVEIKAQIVQEDETEQAARKLLNFGHTIGHVVESLSMDTHDPLFHGEAVSIGMIAESYISQVTGMIDEKTFDKIERGIKTAGLPIRYKGKVTMDEIFEKLVTDKKAERGHIKWTLISGIGQGEFNVSVDDKFVREAIEYILG